MTVRELAEDRNRMLVEAFTSFTAASSALEKSYVDLQGRVRALSEQLEQTNYYLNSVLQSLPCGVLVVDKQKRVMTMNREARRLLDCLDAQLPAPLVDFLRCASFSERAFRLMEGTNDVTEIRLSGEKERILHCSWSRMREGERVLVIQDVTQIRTLEREMQNRERVAAMGEMALEVAHEIRNPLGALELFASLLAEEDLTAEERVRHVSNIRIGIRSLNTVLTNMLCFSRQPRPEMESIKLDRLVEETTRFMEPLFKQRQIEVVIECHSGSRVAGDPEMIRQILTNLITNALQALPEGGRLEVCTAEGDKEATITVKDNGLGIPEDYQKMIFESGFTASKSGSGLGLAIVDRLVKVLNGSISMSSDEGKGTQFTLHFPIEEEKP
jgi:two-component system sensor histidine kinase FlrB